MRAKAIAAVLASSLTLLAAPALADAAPGSTRTPASDSATMLLRGTHGYFVIVTVTGDRAALVAQSSKPEGGDSLVIYSRKLLHDFHGRLHLGLGRAGEVDVRLKVKEVRRSKPFEECVGDPTLTEIGRFVGTISFHPPGGFTEISAHRAGGTVTRRPALVCRDPDGRRIAAARGRAHEDPRLIAGDRDGRKRLEVGAFPMFSKDEPVVPSFTAMSTRKEGPLTIVEQVSALSAPDTAPFAIPGLGALPATVTVEPAAPFSGSATFELESTRTAKVVGDLAVELPEAEEVPLTGPKIAAGICRGFTCSKSLPKALRPSHSGFEITVTSSSGGRFKTSSGS